MDTTSNANVIQDTHSVQLDVDLADISSSVLARLVDEVRNNEPSTIRAFDRVHNRHNR